MNIQLLKDIIFELEKFEEQQPGKSDHTLESFRLYLNRIAYERELPGNITGSLDMDVYELENEICKQVLLLGRYAKSSLKKGLERFPELPNEDFTYLYRLMDYHSLTKMQLIEKNAHEKQTGLEIIKRLLKNKLVQERADKTDKRSKRISVTELGRQTFLASMPDVTVTARVLSAKLSVKEKKNLLETLKKLNEFHQLVYLEMKDADIHAVENLIDGKKS